MYFVGYFFFFFQAEDGIRDFHVTGVQTCALPISLMVSFLQQFSTHFSLEDMSGQLLCSFCVQTSAEVVLSPIVLLTIVLQSLTIKTGQASSDSLILSGRSLPSGTSSNIFGEHALREKVTRMGTENPLSADVSMHEVHAKNFWKKKREAPASAVSLFLLW